MSDRPETRKTADTEAVVRSYLASFEQADPDRIAAHVSVDFVNEHTAALGSGCRGRDAYLSRLPTFLADMAGLHYAVEHLIVDGPEVAVFYRMTADWQGRHAIDVRGAQRLEVRDGLIVHRTDYWDSAAFLVQVDESARQALAPFGIS